MKINQNTLAEAVTITEGGKVSLSIAQVKEVQRLTLEWLATRPLCEVAELFARVVARAEKRMRVRVAQPPRR